MITGNRAFKEGKFAAAEEAYRAAFALKKGYDIAGNLGAAELALGLHREAARHLAFTLRLFPITGDPALREQMKKAFEQCRREVGALRVKVAPAGAAVRVDGAPVTTEEEPRAAGVSAAPDGEAPQVDEVFVDPGEHVVEAALEGYTGGPAARERDEGRVRRGGDHAHAAPSTRAAARTPRPREAQPRARPGARGRVGPRASSAAPRSWAPPRASDPTPRSAGALILAAHKSCVPGAANYDTVRCPPSSAPCTPTTPSTTPPWASSWAPASRARAPSPTASGRRPALGPPDTTSG